ncbi:MAG: SH3 domain-containing protein, partial [Candidatus Hermodarchaeota archaeon]
MSKKHIKILVITVLFGIMLFFAHLIIPIMATANQNDVVSVNSILLSSDDENLHRHVFAEGMWNISPKKTDSLMSTGTNTRMLLLRYIRGMLREHYLYGGNGEVAWYSPFSNDWGTCSQRSTVIGYPEDCTDHYHFDCSGFVYASCTYVGISVPDATASGYYNTYTDPIAMSDLAPGDLVFLNNGASISHVGFYFGEDTVIEAKAPGYGVVQSALSDWINGGYWSGARRIKAEYWPGNDNSYDGVTFITRKTYKINTAGLNIRDGPNTNHAILGVAHQDEIYVSLDFPYSSWNKIFFNSIGGWGSPSYMIEVTGQTIIRVDVSSLNVREGPSTSYPILGQVKWFDEYVTISQSNGWYEIYWHGQTQTECWVSGSYVTVVQQSQQSPPNQPSSLSQLRSDGTTVIPEGGVTSESTMVFKGTVSDPDGDTVRLEIELREMGQTFTGEPTPETISDYVPSGTQVTLTRYGLIDEDYHWQYRAKDANGATCGWVEFGVAGNIDFSVDTTPPGVPTLVSPSDGALTNDNTPYLDWNSVTDVSTYQVQVDDASSFSSPQVDTTTTNTYYTTPALSDNMYYWRIRAQDAAGNWGAWSSVWSFTIDTTGPLAPTLVSPSDGVTTNDNTPLLDWNAVSGATLYQVQVDDSAS